MEMAANDGIALGIERDGADRRPVACATGPACRMACSRLEIRSMARLQDRVVLAGMALRGRDVANAAVPRCSKLYQRTKSCPQPRASSRVAKPRGGNSGRYLAVLNSDSTRALSSETRGREYDGLTPGQWSIASTVVAFNVLPLSPCSTGLSCIAWTPSASAVRFTRCTAWPASSRSWISQPTILRLYRSR